MSPERCLRREPLIGLLGCCAHVQDDGSREPGTGVLRPLRGVRGPATQGMCPLGAPDERGHKDGWGLACFQNGLLKVHMRDAGSATDASKYYGTAWKIAKLN